MPVPARHTASDVVLLSLEELNPRAELRRQVRKGLAGPPEPELDVSKHLLEIQMNIVRETAKFGPVLLLAPDETTKNAVEQRCEEFQICELLRSDRVRIKVVAHDGAWIRDFGPQIEAAGDSAHVVHWRYFDIRAEEAKRKKFQELETARLRLMETRQQEDQPDTLTHETSPEARKAAAATIDDRLYLLREYSQILNEASIQRISDDASAYDIADALLAAPDFSYKSSGVALDGGNLFKLEDGRCLTTRVLLSRNKEQTSNVDQELEKVGGCKLVTYLEPLPGAVIEHVDMFVLPAGGNRILLASYDLSTPFAAECWSRLSNAERDLAVNADLAMKWNAERLRRLGYEVVPVSSPFPRIPPNGHTYYPSVLNALVREGADGSRQLVIPSYKDYETDIQSAAWKQIEAAFGPRTELLTVEATEAAKAQGAIHCLTLTAPLSVSIFADSADSARRTESLARKEQLDRSAATEIAAQIPATGLQGAWVILEKNEPSDETALQLYPKRIFFGERQFQKGVLDRVEVEGKYSIDRRDAATWTLRFVFPDQNFIRGSVQWISNDEVKLVLGDGDTALVLRRIDTGPISPFEPGKQGSQQAVQPGRGKPATAAGNASGGLERAQP